MEYINISDCSEIEYTTDQVGKVLFYENRVFRAINLSHENETRDLLNSGLLKELIDKQLFPKTWISNVRIENYSLILEHERINNWNYPYEWSYDMLKDAGLMILKVNTIANKYGYQIMDAHAYNTVFKMSKPQYIDFGSFMKINEKGNNAWKSYNLFYMYFYMPLFLWSKEFSGIARSIFLISDNVDEYEMYRLRHPMLFFIGGKKLFNFLRNIEKVSLSSDETIVKHLTNPIKKSIVLAIRSLFKQYFTSNKLETKINKITKSLETSMWNDYHDTVQPSTEYRFIRIKEIIQELEDADSVVELASNQGKFAEFILDSTHIKKIIATDYDKEAVNIMYKNNKHRDNFLPLLFDIVRPNSRRYDVNIDQRIKSDIVMALAVTHHLLLTQKIPLDYIFNTMLSLTNKYIIVEFMPIGLYGGELSNVPELPEFYNLEWFKFSFMKYFDLILDEELEVNRHVFLGKIKNCY